MKRTFPSIDIGFSIFKENRLGFSVTIVMLFTFCWLVFAHGDTVESQYKSTHIVHNSDSIPLDTLSATDTDTTTTPCLIDSSDTTVSDSDSVAYTDSISSDSIFSDSTFRDSVVTTQTDTIDTVDTSHLYPGITLELDKMAIKMVYHIYAFEWNKADKIGRKMNRLERKSHLPPLSYLLRISMRVVRLHNGNFPEERAESTLMREIDRLSEKGLELSEPDNFPDSLRPTNILIHGGIKGFVATLKISSNPLDAALEGLGALKMLEQLLESNPEIKDAYLGPGIFYCALAKAPALLRGALNLAGKSISLDTGIAYLRTSAYEGRYTSPAGKQYLIQFLSPYWGHLAEEKREIFKSLQEEYPQNPYYLFLELDENLCFFPERIFEFNYRELLKQKINTCKSENYSQERFLNLVKWQSVIVNPFPSATLEPDTTFKLREYDFYPVFLQALREKLLFEHIDKDKSIHSNKRVQFIKRTGYNAIRELKSSPMKSSHKGFYLWHIRAALGL